MKHIRVLMFGWEFPPHHSGGLGEACYGLTRSLTRRGVSVTFVLPKKQPGMDHKFLRIVFANVKSIKFRTVNAIIAPYMTSEEYDEHLLRLPLREQYGLNLFDEVRRYGLLARQIAIEEPHDVIHAHDWLSFRAGIEAKRASGKPLIVHVHATEFDRTGGHPNQYIYEEERRGLHAADRIIAVSELTKRTIVEHYDIPASKVTVIYNGVDHQELRKPLPSALSHLKAQGKKIVLFLGRMTIQKGPDHFLRTAKRVLEYEPNTVFVLIGGGDMEKQMIRLAQDLGIGNNVIFTGALFGDDRTMLWRAADIYVAPSVSEPFGIVALESLVHGIPLLVSKQTGAAEVIANALKSDFWDVDDMADKIVSVLRSRGLHDTLAELGAREVEQCTWDVASEHCTKLYQVATANA